MDQTQGTPAYAHDCASCTFLGGFVDRAGDRYDLYHCAQGGALPTVIARWGNDGPDYLSGMVFARAHREDMGSAIGAAYRQACARGLVAEAGR